MLRFDGSLVLVGAGKMGGSLLEGWLSPPTGAGIVPQKVYLRDPHPPAEIARFVAEKGLDLNSSIEKIAASVPRVVVLAVKPQVMGSVLPDLRRLVRPGTFFLSIAAGIDLARLGEGLGHEAAIVRAMPNTPASIGLGITAAFANEAVNADDRAVCDALLGAVGEAVWLSAESQMDAVTALSGSGPAYVFTLAESMAAAGETLGLEPALAQQLARATVAGAGAMLGQLPEDAMTLRKNVTSPGGTTAAALDVLLDADGLVKLVRRAMTAARERSRELAK